MTELLFQKSLQDLVKGIRAHKNDPSEFIAQAINEIKRYELTLQACDVCLVLCDTKF